MKLKELYNRDIERKVNPAVSASDFDEETVHTEIEEYVFTDEIIQGLYNILSAVQKKEKNHCGIWINGYFGSGKSHFLKYLDYCLSPKYGQRALERLMEAVEERDPLQHPDSKLDLTVSDMKDLIIWMKNNQVDTILFNIGTVHNINGNEKKVFLDVFWAELNAFRGYNKFNIALAQNFEKLLDSKGKFDEFKKRIAEDGFDWDEQASDLADQELDYVLDLGKELVPTMTTDIIRKRIVEDDSFISVETFMKELKGFIDSKGKNYHLLFLVDEISQFIDGRGGLLLQLQEIVTRLHEVCNDRVWLGCTAQQDLSELLDDCKISKTSEDYGKIMGRFEVKVSLKGTQPEYITQKRILDKTGSAEIELGKLYEKKKSAIDNQFQLPSGYRKFSNKEEFIAYYPFVPYQFKLIMQVFNSFVSLGFVEREVKGNERSIIKVTHATAKQTKDEEVGKFISFDQFFNAMFQGSLMNLGQRAIQNANGIIQDYKDPKFGQRVVNILFMICYLSETDKLLFPATVENITNLLMTDVDTQKLSLKHDVQEVLDFLCEKNIIRYEAKKGTASDYYCFYTEDEMEVAQLIKNQQVDNATMAEELKKIFFDYMGNPANRETYCSNKFSIACFIMGRSYLSNNADIEMELVMEDDFGGNQHQYALQNKSNKLSFLIGPLYYANSSFRNDFFNFCKVQQYLKTPATGERRKQTMDDFRKRARETYDSKIVPEFRKMFDNCEVVSSQDVITAKLASLKGAQRYKSALESHFENIYPYGRLVTNQIFPRTSDDLRKAVLRKIATGEYEGLNAELTDPEKPVEAYLLQQGRELSLGDITKKFSGAPYGWNELCTMYIVNELVRRHKRDYSFNNDPNTETKIIATAMTTSDRNKIVVRPAQAISRDILDKFINAWKKVFGFNSAPSNDSSELFRGAKEKLKGVIESMGKVRDDVSKYPFVSPVVEAVRLFEEWESKRDPIQFFNAIIQGEDKGKELVDRYKEIKQFADDQLPRYVEFLRYIDNNKENFNFLSDEKKHSAEKFKELVSDETPFERMPSYNKLKKEIEAALNEIKKGLCAEIAANYEKAYTDLQGVCKENGVPESILPNLQSTITSKTNTDNLYALKDNRSTDEFYTQWVKVILDKKNPNGDGNKTGKKTASITLNTRTRQKLTNESEVDDYLAQLKQQLMKHINDNEDVMVIK